MASRFPKGFLFGAATAAHQVEGNNHNDWSAWERRNAERLAKQAREKPYLPPETHSPGNYISSLAVDHYNRYEEDLTLATELGLNCFRFSIEWSRVCPKEGAYDENAINHYRKIIKACCKHGLEPFVTLWHFTLPLWAEELGGWESRRVITAFADFAERMAGEYGNHVTFWGTFNEPNVYAGAVYLPPPLVPVSNKWLDYPSGWFHYLRARRCIVKAHRLAYRRIKAIQPTAQVGICLNLIYYDKVHRDPLSIIMRQLRKYATNGYFARKVADTCDWIGIQYYQRTTVEGLEVHNDGRYPGGHREILRDMARFGKPLYFTETGVSDNLDQHRAKYIEESLASIAEAIELDGTDCRGYIHWSLLDGFEWTEGFWRLFGLIRVDYKDPKLKRTIKKSGYAYAAAIQRWSHKN